MRQFAVLLLAVLLTACAAEADSNLRPLDLTPYSIPLSILAPDSARVVSNNMGSVMQDVTVSSPEDDYAIQILASTASTNDMARLKAEQLELVRDNRYFNSIVEEAPNGFLFENRIDTTNYYGFRHIVYQGDREFVFQNDLASTLSLDEARRLYAAVRPNK